MRFYFEEAALWKQTKQKVVQQINELGLPLVIFGKTTESNPALLQGIQVPTRFVCSTHPQSWGSEHWGLEVTSPDRIAAVYPAYTLLNLALDYRNELPALFRQFPLPPAALFQMDLHYDDDNTADYFQEKQLELEDVYHRLADETSRETYEAVIRYRINRDPVILKPVVLPLEEQYFPKTLGGKPFLHDRESFVDAGAYTGDTVNRFVAAVMRNYRRITAFEPDPSNYRSLKENTKGVSRFSSYSLGVGDEAKAVSFFSQGTSSKVSVHGQEQVQIDALDHLLGDTPVTYLKMDVEGMERAALLGANSLLQRQRPKLAICMYHSNEDMVMVPKLILEQNPAYRLYCRHYTNAVTETVCYAI